jgi:hypothetical protein
MKAAGTRIAAALLVALGASGCGGSDESSPAPAEQVCRLLADDDVETTLSAGSVTHAPTASTPRSCSWSTNGEPVVQLTVTSTKWRDTAPRAPCGAAAPATTTVPGAGAALFGTCAAGDMAVTATVRTADRPAVTALLDRAVSQVGSIDRAAFGIDAIGPPECLEAWRAGTNAPVHCEEHPLAYRETVGRPR